MSPVRGFDKQLDDPQRYLMAGEPRTDRGWTKQDAVLTAIVDALTRWDAAERRARDLRSITKADVRRVDRLPNGTRILHPRRTALARYLTDAALTAIREYENPATREWEAEPDRPILSISEVTPNGR